MGIIWLTYYYSRPFIAHKTLIRKYTQMDSLLYENPIIYKA